MAVRLLAVAEAELQDAVQWYDAQVPGLGSAFLLECLRILQLVGEYPDAWQQLSKSVRRCRLSRYPYAVVYARDGQDVIILAIAHLHRKPGYWRTRLTDEK
jgi:plasmid stabilization system protein ParE